MAEVQEGTDYEQFEEANANGDFQEQAATTESESMETNEQAGGDATVADDGTNEDERKLFVGGLSWETTTKDLKEYFGKFGDVVNCTLKTDLETKRSRGFGFIVFAKTETVDKVLEEKEQLKLHGRTIDPKRANPRTGARKIFVGRVDPACSEEDIKTYFSTFGKVEKIDLPFDKIKDQRRAFCFVEFESEEGVKKVLDQQKHVLSGQEVDIKKATPTGQGRGGGRGGARGGRGGWNQGWGNQGYGNQGYNNYGYGNQGYGGYGGGYGGYGGAYDYNQGYGYGGWGGYDQSYGNYGGYGGYDYSGGWGAYGQQDQTQQQSSYGKTGGSKRGGVMEIT
ncbi:heterogeneous nuclear ribonucleoprotein D-like [Patella vulgata]|uniref:heterogeneous nuclear ribonucleoprotein D-like n=1 Tax=Patella vulgata TaxID=6465 RepID=UPI002180222E|nr:heterogeneous nuclear ribonucleoprotein D-like [Patella vulgata]